jgi:uncharacterized protein with PIN domain
MNLVTDLDRCPSCGTPITHVDPAAPRRTQATSDEPQIETAVCPGCGLWLSRRRGARWQSDG